MQSGNNAMEMIHFRCCQVVRGWKKGDDGSIHAAEPQIIVAWLAMFWVGRLKEAVQSS
jgi:hypothetical protein